MTTVFLVGHGPTALPTLKGLLDRFTVVSLARPRPEGAPDSTLVLADRMGIPVETDPSLDAVGASIRARRPDCLVVSSYHRILPAWVLDLVGAAVNVHFAPLPRYRGRATVNWAMINGESAATISIHRIAVGLDAGDILYQEDVAIGPDDTVATLYVRLNELLRKNVAGAVTAALEEGTGVAQVQSDSTYCCGRVPDDGLIDWAQPTTRIDRLIRALAIPFPAAFTYLDGVRLDILSARPLDDAPRYEGRVPGRIVGRSTRAGHVDVLTGDGVLRLKLVGLAGQPARAAAEIITTTRATLGVQIPQLMDRIARLEQLVATLLVGRAADDSAR